MIKLSDNIVISEEDYKKCIMAMSEIVDMVVNLTNQAAEKNVENEFAFAYSNFYGNILREGTLETMRKHDVDSEEEREEITNATNKVMMSMLNILE